MNQAWNPSATFQRCLATVLGAIILCCPGWSYAQEESQELHELSERIEQAVRDHERLSQLESLSGQNIKLLRHLKKLHESIARSESDLQEAKDDGQKIERMESELEKDAVRIEITMRKLDLLERRTELKELASEFARNQPDFSAEAKSLLDILDEASARTEKFAEALLKENEERAGELEMDLMQLEHRFERRREVLQLRFELGLAREEGDEEWIRELEAELNAIQSANRDLQPILQSRVANLPGPFLLTKGEIARASKLDLEKDILPLLRTTCFDCHAKDSASGDLNLENLVSTVPLAVNRSHWLNVIEQLKVRSMPPADADQPSDADRRAMLGWLTDAIENFDYTTVRQAGFVPAKRLTHDEYNNTVRDLVGVDLRPADRFPADLTASSGFDNSANSLFIQPVTLERYLGAAESIVREAWPMNLAPVQVSGSSSRHPLVSLGGPAPQNRPLNALQALESEENISIFLRQFASRAYRRPLDELELSSLVAHFEHRRESEATSAIALRQVLQVILISPNFLIRSESAPANRDSMDPISDWELASRLSYFLWASMPDEELFQLAREHRLHKPSVLAQQVDRMLDDVKAETLGALFAGQWLGFAELDRVQRDQIENPWATDSLVEAMQGESAMLFNSIVRGNESIDRLLDAEHTFINAELAKHYRIDGVEGKHLRKVSLLDTPRRGILGHASILATTSFPRRTSPVLRGNWVLTTLLGTPPPPPPPNVSEFDDRVADNERLTQRQKLELHRSNPRCYACHSEIDPLGFALEEFEWFGRHRPQRRGRPVDAIGKLPNGTQFRGLQGLSETLLNERSHDLAVQLTRKMLAYALGRQLEYFDEASVQELTIRFEADQRKIRSLIHAIIRSDTFLTKQRSPDIQSGSTSNSSD